MRISSWGLLGSVALCAGLYEVVLIGSLSGWLAWIRPALPGAAILFLLNRPQGAYILLATSGILADLFQATPSGFALVRLLVVALVMELVGTQIATNRSLYAAWLIVIAGWGTNLLLLFGTRAGGWLLFGLDLPMEPMETWGWILGGQILLVSILFIGFSFLTRRFYTTLPSGTQI